MQQLSHNQEPLEGRKLPPVIRQAMIDKGFVNAKGEPSYAALSLASGVDASILFNLIHNCAHQGLITSLDMCQVLNMHPTVMEAMLGLPEEHTRPIIRAHLKAAGLSITKARKLGRQSWLDGIPETAPARRYKRVFVDLLGIPLTELPYALLIKIPEKSRDIVESNRVDLSHRQEISLQFVPSTNRKKPMAFLPKLQAAA